jgi:hypothetical protein
MVTFRDITHNNIMLGIENSLFFLLLLFDSSFEATSIDNYDNGEYDLDNELLTNCSIFVVGNVCVKFRPFCNILFTEVF